MNKLSVLDVRAMMRIMHMNTMSWQKEYRLIFHPTWYSVVDKIFKVLALQVILKAQTTRSQSSSESHFDPFDPCRCIKW